MAKSQSLQDPFLNALRKEKVPVSIYLVNGIKLQGQIDSFDQFVVLLRNSVRQMVYKHAISTVVPARNVAHPGHGRGRGRGLDAVPSRREVSCSTGRAAANVRCYCTSVSTDRASTTKPRSSEHWQILPARVSSAKFKHGETPDPKFFVGSGKVDEIAARARETQAELILVNQPLRAGQERNLEQVLKTRVLDRNGLILDIFAQRAATFEGKLQVELAQHEHLASRLVRGWTHLERQKGGIGLRGPGETQLETDRRLVSRRIRHLRERLERVERQRDVSRKERQRADVPTVALVGYTNAGKTTLFNALAGADLVATDQLFATLDPTVRRLPLGGGAEALLVDTVGFVRDLPHELVAAFRATLTETREADVAAARHRCQRSAPRRSPAAGRGSARGHRRCRRSVVAGVQ